MTENDCFKYMWTQTELVVSWASFLNCKLGCITFVNTFIFEFIVVGSAKLHFNQFQLYSIRYFFKVGCKRWWNINIKFSIKCLKVRKAMTKFIANITSVYVSVDMVGKCLQVLQSVLCYFAGKKILQLYPECLHCWVHFSCGLS